MGRWLWIGLAICDVSSMGRWLWIGLAICDLSECVEQNNGDEFGCAVGEDAVVATILG
jgi:hypothetical protein